MVLTQISLPFAGCSTMYCAERLPPAPGLFSTIIVSPRILDISSAITRA